MGSSLSKKIVAVWRGSKVKATNRTESSLHVAEPTNSTGSSFQVAEPTISTKSHVAEAINSPGSPLQLAEVTNAPGSSLQATEATDSTGSPLHVPEPINSTGSSLHVLPVEILQYISATLLPLDAAASLSLCNHSMLNLLGDEALHSLRSQTHAVERTRFLKGLEKDCPDLLLCHHCSVLHPVNHNTGPDQDWDNDWSDEPQCLQLDGLVKIGNIYRIRFEDAYTLMRDYRLGRDYETKLEKLSVREDFDLPEVYHEEVVTATIVAGELRLHIQYTLRPRIDWDEDFIWDEFAYLCTHIEGYFDDSIFVQALRCNLSHVDGLPCVDCKQIKHCSECSTSFQVEVREPEDLVTEVKIDVWRDLGSCESPFDAKWRSQADQYLLNTDDTQGTSNDQGPIGRILRTLEELEIECTNIRDDIATLRGYSRLG